MKIKFYSFHDWWKEGTVSSDLTCFPIFLPLALRSDSKGNKFNFGLYKPEFLYGKSPCMEGQLELTTEDIFTVGSS